MIMTLEQAILYRDALTAQGCMAKCLPKPDGTWGIEFDAPKGMSHETVKVIVAHAAGAIGHRLGETFLHPDDAFALRNDPPTRQPIGPVTPDNARQMKLLDGLDCLEGQQDLF